MTYGIFMSSTSKIYKGCPKLTYTKHKTYNLFTAISFTMFCSMTLCQTIPTKTKACVLYIFFPRKKNYSKLRQNFLSLLYFKLRGVEFLHKTIKRNVFWNSLLQNKSVDRALTLVITTSYSVVTSLSISWSSGSVESTYNFIIIYLH